MKYACPLPLANNKDLAYQIGQHIFNTTGESMNCFNHTGVGIDFPEFTDCTFEFTDIFPSYIKRLPASRQICTINVHPDIAWAINQEFSTEWELPIYNLRLYLALLNQRCFYFDLETKETNLPYNFKSVQLPIPHITLSEHDFARYQDYMKHFPVEDIVGKRSINIEVNGQKYHNVYDILGYVPMKWNDLLELQGTLV